LALHHESATAANFILAWQEYMKKPVLQLTAMINSDIIVVSVPTLLESTYNQTGYFLFS
jgi:hypothetical protein